MNLIRAYLIALSLMPPGLLDAIAHVESRGNPWAVSHSGCVGLLQVCPRWSPLPRWALFVPMINRAEAARQLAYWHGKAHGNWRRALASYRCGWRGLRGECGNAYARAVLARARKAR